MGQFIIVKEELVYLNGRFGKNSWNLLNMPAFCKLVFISHLKFHSEPTHNSVTYVNFTENAANQCEQFTKKPVPLRNWV